MAHSQAAMLPGQLTRRLSTEVALCTSMPPSLVTIYRCISLLPSPNPSIAVSQLLADGISGKIASQLGS